MFRSIENLFDALTLNIPTQFCYFQCLRGVGKTVLINRLQNIAEDKGIFCKHIEIEERNDFISQLASCSQAFLRKISMVEGFRHLIQKPLELLSHWLFPLTRMTIHFHYLCRKENFTELRI